MWNPFKSAAPVVQTQPAPLQLDPSSHAQRERLLRRTARLIANLDQRPMMDPDVRASKQTQVQRNLKLLDVVYNIADPLAEVRKVAV